MKITCRLLAVGTQSLLDLRQVTQRRRTHIGALGKAKENGNHLAAIVGQRAFSARVIGQRKVARVICSRDVHAIEFLRVAAAAGTKQCGYQ